MVLQERIELSTSPLPRECSTTELLQHRLRQGRNSGPRAIAASTAIGAFSTQGQKAPNQSPAESSDLVNALMSKSDEARLREQRLAAKLRENLKRRKVQARARTQSEDNAPAPTTKPPADGGKS